MEDETPAIGAARRTCFFAQSAFRRGGRAFSHNLPFGAGMAAVPASRQGLRRRCFVRAMSAACGKISPANSVRQGGRGGRARRQSRWPGARFCGGSASGAGMAADLAMRRVAARIAPSLLRPGDERSLREDQSSEQRPAGRPRRSGAPAEPMAGSALLKRVCFRRGNGRSSGNAARIAALLRVGDRSFEGEVQRPECGGQYKARPS